MSAVCVHNPSSSINCYTCAFHVQCSVIEMFQWNVYYWKPISHFSETEQNKKFLPGIPFQNQVKNFTWMNMLYLVSQNDFFLFRICFPEICVLCQTQTKGGLTECIEKRWERGERRIKQNNFYYNIENRHLKLFSNIKTRRSLTLMRYGIFLRN